MDLQLFAGEGMGKMQSFPVKRLSAKADGAAPVHRIPEQRMPHMAQVNPDLMRPPGFKAYMQQARARVDLR